MPATEFEYLESRIRGVRIYFTTAGTSSSR
jgi:hypothetical protein